MKGLLNRPGAPKLPIKQAKMVESTSFGDAPLKSSGYPKTVGYSPQKLPELLKIVSFEDVPFVMYRI